MVWITQKGGNRPATEAQLEIQQNENGPEIQQNENGPNKPN